MNIDYINVVITNSQFQCVRKGTTAWTVSPATALLDTSVTKLQATAPLIVSLQISVTQVQVFNNYFTSYALFNTSWRLIVAQNQSICHSAVPRVEDVLGENYHY